MKDNLLAYMEKRFKQRKGGSQTEYSRSFVTISRQCGCFGNSIAKVLVEKLNAEQEANKPDWQILNKEVIDAAAKELRVDKKHVKEIFELHQQGVLEDFFTALSKNAGISDLKIRKTIKDVVQNFAKSGGYVIVGRAGVIITRDIPYGIHVRVEASEQWRVQQVSNRLDLSPVEARKNILLSDKKREQFKKHFVQSKEEKPQYDLILNNERVNVYEAAELIYTLMKVRNHL